MKCPYCKGEGYTHVQWENFYRVHTIRTKCWHCDGKGEIEPTNEEFIRNCTTEELAEIIATRIRETHNMFEYILHQDNRREEDLVREIREWLKEKKK